MTLPVVFHTLAEDELDQAAAFHARAGTGMGDAFLTEVQHAVDILIATPLAGKVVNRDIRWWVLRRFPYSILYRVCADHIRILAIAHHKRQPFYWRSRQ